MFQRAPCISAGLFAGVVPAAASCLGHADVAAKFDADRRWSPAANPETRR